MLSVKGLETFLYLVDPFKNGVAVWTLIMI